MASLQKGSAVALATGAAAEINKRLDRISTGIDKLVAWFEQRHYYELETTFTAKANELSRGFSEQIAQGYIFIPQRIAVTAPEGTRLEIYSNNESAANFLEVITNVQVYSEAILGPWVLFGPGRLVFVATKAKAEGSVTLTISGQLVKRLPDGTHIP